MSESNHKAALNPSWMAPVGREDSEEYQPGHRGEGHGIGAYLVIFAILMVLLVATVAVALVPWHKWNMGYMGVIVAMAIASVKALLVVLYFMHVLHSTKLTKLFVFTGIFWLVILIGMTLNDYVTRAWTPASAGWPSKTRELAPAPEQRLGEPGPKGHE